MKYKKSLEKFNAYLLSISLKGKEKVNSSKAKEMKRDLSIITNNTIKGNHICKTFTKEELIKRRLELKELLKDIPNDMKDEIKTVRETIDIIEGTINNYSLLQEH
jgi:hypothetical protein